MSLFIALAGYQPDPPERFLGPRFRATHDHKSIGAPDRHYQLATSRRPNTIEFLQVDVNTTPCAGGSITDSSGAG